MSTLYPELITFVVCSYNRPRKLERLIESIEEHFPGTDIIIGDVGDTPLLSDRGDHVKVVRHEWPDGVPNPNIANLSAGRNLALSAVGSPYFVLIDDDHFFSRPDDVIRMQEVMRSNNPRLDVVGGNYENLRPGEEPDTTVRWWGRILKEGKGVMRLYTPRLKHADTPQTCDFVNNFFMGDTQKVRAMGGWDEEIPIVAEHLDFFLSAKLAGLKVAHLDSCSVKHDPGADVVDPERPNRMTPEKRNYQNMRRRFQYRMTFYKKWQITKMQQHNGVGYVVEGGQVKNFVIKPQDSVGVVVLTTGRSGSSAIAQCLSLMGVCMGEELGTPREANRDVNPDGYFEDLFFIDMGHGGSVTTDTLEDDWDYHLCKMATNYSRWGVKNPRLGQHAKLLLRVAQDRGFNLRFVWVHRPLEKCIRSLNRAGWAEDYTDATVKMTRRYNLIKKAYDSIPDHLRYRIEFEAVAENPLTEIRQLAHWLGVTEGKAVVTAAESIREDFIHF